MGTVVLCGAFMLGASSPATAANDPKAQLKILDAAKGGATKTAWLHCGPAGGTHPHAREACRLLRAVHGKPDALNVKPQTMCTHDVAPHAVVIAGRWFGQDVSWAKVFSNACALKAATGAVLAL
ncbi:SSI family serine proteinase inhibitor [Nonomuraea jiangxiensis]|nr:SSI family serine proteinase inhibitor [Nonomuraea jiangxiensis]